MKKIILTFCVCLMFFAVSTTAETNGTFLDGRMVEEIQAGRSVYIYYTIGGYDHRLSIDQITPLGGRYLLEGYAKVVDTNASVSFMGTFVPLENEAKVVVAAVSDNPWYEPAHCLLMIDSSSNHMEGRSTIDGLWYDGTWSW